MIEYLIPRIFQTVTGILIQTSFAQKPLHSKMILFLKHCDINQDTVNVDLHYIFIDLFELNVKF